MNRHFISGVNILKKYKEEFLKYEKERQELTNAERLFDLNITLYQDMQQIEKDLRGMDMIYSIYEKQKVQLLNVLSLYSMDTSWLSPSEFWYLQISYV